MAGKLNTEGKDEPPPALDCGDCVGDKPQEGNVTCITGCIVRQMKASAGKPPIPVEA